MEFPAKVVILERVLAAAFLAALGGLWRLESRSTVAEAVREQRPWLCWLALAAPPAEPQLSLAVYQPSRPALGLIHFPQSARLEGRRTLARVYAEALRRAGGFSGAARAEAAAAQEWLSSKVPEARGLEAAFLAEKPRPFQTSEPPLAAKAWVLEQTQGLGFWKNLARRLTAPRPASSLSRFDELSLALNWHRLSPDQVRAAWLCESGELASLFARLSSARPAPGPARTLTAEVLNASGRKGIASQATKVLRLHGVDVISYGNVAKAPEAAAETLIYDRTGRIENAAAVRDMLRCSAAQALTEIDSKRLVDVTVVLAADCQGVGR